MTLERRDLLKATASGSLAMLAGEATAVATDSTQSAAARRPAQSQRIREENGKAGSTDWQLTRVRLDRVGGFRSPWIEGYCSAQSVKAGDELEIMVSTNPPKRFRFAIATMGARIAFCSAADPMAASIAGPRGASEIMGPFPIAARTKVF